MPLISLELWLEAIGSPCQCVERRDTLKQPFYTMSSMPTTFMGVQKLRSFADWFRHFKEALILFISTVNLIHDSSKMLSEFNSALLPSGGRRESFDQ
jgi:hypothetical protein